MGVVVVLVLREKIGGVGVSVGAPVVGVAVLVDNDRCRAGRDQPVAERLRQEPGLEHVGRRTGREDASGEE